LDPLLSLQLRSLSHGTAEKQPRRLSRRERKDKPLIQIPGLVPDRPPWHPDGIPQNILEALPSNQVRLQALDYVGRSRIPHALQWTGELRVVPPVMILEANIEVLASIERAIDAGFARDRTFRLVLHISGSYHTKPHYRDRLYCG